jgi:FlaA1/EpsC-like NDP-sugar epimerase
VDNCLLVSSDKAKDPCSAMGHSKHLAELLLRYRSLACGSTNFKIVRFGNVLGSTGSLLPKLLEQLSNGWDVTVTDPKATRYFMSLSEAVELTLHTMQLSESGDIFSLDMGQAHAIGPLIERFIHAYRDKLDPTLKVNIREIGLYDGERLHEPCLIDEHSVRTSYPKIYTSQSALPFEEALFWDHWDNLLRQLQSEPFNPNALIPFMDRL